MVDKRKGKMVLVKVNDLNDDELDTTIDKLLDTLFEDKEDKSAETAKTKTVKSPSHRRKTTQVSKKKGNSN